MPTNHDAVPALPSAGGANHALLRNLLVTRMAYCLAADEDAQDLVAVDPQSGATILALVQNGRVYAWDPDDTTSAHDGTAILVSFDGQRYKLDALSMPYHVLDKDLTEPPAEPEIGDAYLLIDPGTGDWAGLGPIVTLTGRGWEEIGLPIGRMVYVADEDAYYHRKPNGDIVAGLGVGSISEGSLMPRHLMRGGDLVTWQVVNRTTQAPPGSPSEGDTYIAAAGSTGAWAGWDGSIVRRENDAWQRYVPATGWRAYDTAENLTIVFQSPNWVVQASGYNEVKSAFAAAIAALTAAGSNAGGYEFSETPPTQTTNRRIAETITIELQAQFAGQVFALEYIATITENGLSLSAPGTNATLAVTAAVFVDSASNAADWQRATSVAAPGTALSSAIATAKISASFSLALNDTSPHTISVILFPRIGAGNITGGNLSLARRRLTARRRA